MRDEIDTVVVIELRGPDQGLISTTAVALEQGWYLIKPGAGLPQGNHTLSYVALCNGEVPRTRTEHRFKVGPAVAWPTALGATRVGASVGGWQGICGGYRAWAPLLVEGSTELLAHAFATRFDVTFKGTSKRSEYGIALQMPTGPFELPLELMCSAAQPRISGTVTITAHVEGAPSDPPPVTLAVEIDCPHLAEPGACGTVGPDGGSGTVGPDGGNPSPVDGGAPVPPRMDGGSSPDVQPLGPTDAGPGRSDAPATTPPPPSGGGSGCQMAPGAATAWWLAVLLAAPWLRRRYRSRSG